MVPWFNILGYPYDAAIHGTPSDWVLDLVSLGFDKSSGDEEGDRQELAMIGGLADAVSGVEEGCHFTPAGAADVTPMPRMLAQQQQQQQQQQQRKRRSKKKSCFEEDDEDGYGPSSSSGVGNGVHLGGGSAGLQRSFSEEEVQDYVARQVTADALSYTMSNQGELEQAAAAFRYCQEQLQPQWFGASGNSGSSSGLKYKSHTDASGRSYVSLTDLEQQRGGSGRRKGAEAQPACGCFKSGEAERVRAAATRALEEQLRLEDSDAKTRAQEEHLRTQLAGFDTQTKRFKALGHSLQVPVSVQAAERGTSGKGGAAGAVAAAEAGQTVAVVSAVPASSLSSSSPVNDHHQQELVERQFSSSSSTSGFETAYSGPGRDVRSLLECDSPKGGATTGRGFKGSGGTPGRGAGRGQIVGGGSGRGVAHASYKPEVSGDGSWTWSPRSGTDVVIEPAGESAAAAGRGGNAAPMAMVKSGGFGGKVKQQGAHFKALAWRDYLMTTR